VGNLAAPEVDRGLDLVTFMKNSCRVVLLEIVIVLVGAGPEFYFLDGDDRLFSLGLLLLFLLLVLIFSEIDDAANRWSRLRRDLDQVEALGSGYFEGLLRAFNAQLRPIIVDDSDFLDPDPLVYANGRPPVTPACLKPANIRSSRTKTPALSSPFFWIPEAWATNSGRFLQRDFGSQLPVNGPGCTVREPARLRCFIRYVDFTSHD
jgi:hypothetical protein